MAFRHGRWAEITLNSIAMSTFCDTMDLSFDVDTSETTTFTKTAKTYVVGTYGGTCELSGSYDPTASTGPAVTLEALIGAEAVALVAYPGGSATSPAQRKLTANVILTSYKTTSGVGDKVTFSASLLIDGVATWAAAT
jgi:hypothetical protein